MYPMQWVAAVFVVILVALVLELGFGIDLGIRDMIDAVVGSGNVNILPD